MIRLKYHRWFSFVDSPLPAKWTNNWCVVVRLSGVLVCGEYTDYRQSVDCVGYQQSSVTGIFHRHNRSGHTMAVGWAQPLTDMSARNISWGVKAAGA